MERRTALKRIGAVGVGASVSGCNGILGGNCGPGEDEIGAVAAAVNPAPATATAGTATTAEATAADATARDVESVRITGEIRSTGDDEAVIDDGTGRAELSVLFDGSTAREFEDGDCVQASGVPFAPAAGSDHDIRLLVEDIEVADS